MPLKIDEESGTIAKSEQIATNERMSPITEELFDDEEDLDLTNISDSESDLETCVERNVEVRSDRSNEGIQGSLMETMQKQFQEIQRNLQEQLKEQLEQMKQTQVVQPTPYPDYYNKVSISQIPSQQQQQPQMNIVAQQQQLQQQSYANNHNQQQQEQQHQNYNDNANYNHGFKENWNLEALHDFTCMQPMQSQQPRGTTKEEFRQYERNYKQQFERSNWANPNLPREYQKGGWRGTFMRVPEMEPYQSLNLVAIDELRTGDYERYHIRHYILKDEKDLEFFSNLFLLAQTMDIQGQDSVIWQTLEITSTSQKKNIFNREYKEYLQQLPFWNKPKTELRSYLKKKMGLLNGRHGRNYYRKHIESFQGAMTQCMFALSVKHTSGLLRDVGRFELVFRDFGSESLLNMKVITDLEECEQKDQRSK